MDEQRKPEETIGGREETPFESEGGKSGEIRYKLDQRSRIRGGILQFLTLLLAVVLTSAVTATLVTRRIAEDTLVIDNGGNFAQMLKKSLESFEASFYDRQKLRDIYEDVALSVVGVANSREAFDGISYDNVWSGVVMNTEGYILVPYSVVAKEGTPVYIRSDRDSGNIREAEVIGRDMATDTAVVRVQGVTLRPPRFSDSSTVKVAQSVAAIGNPFGDRARGTLTFGVISTTNKMISTLTEDNREIKIYAMETDALVNRGTNGGVLVNMNGEVIGINSFSLSEDFNGGFGAVITSNEARSIARALINSGEILIPFMGVFGNLITDTENNFTGYYIQRVTPEGTADRAGLRPTDIILSIDGVPVQTATTVDEYVKTKQVGDVVIIQYRRSSAVMETEATLFGTVVD